MSTSTTPGTDYARNAELSDLVTLLREQRGTVHDFVTGAGRISSVDGVWHVTDAEQDLTDAGVTSRVGRYRPTAYADDQMATKLGIPTKYLQRLRAERPDLYDANVNNWLVGDLTHPADARRFMLRTFADVAGGEGVARAVLSDSYKVIDNLDVLMSVLAAINDAGIEARVRRADLTESRMHVKIDVPGITAAAPKLLDGYRSPFANARLDQLRGGNPNGDGQVGDVVSAGVRITNSEVGGGAFTITPEIVVLACTNGMTMAQDAIRAVHLGSKLDDGQIHWSAETQQRNLDLIKAKTGDAVRAFLSPDFLAKKVAAIEAKAGDDLSAPVNDTVITVGKQLAWSDTEQAGILDCFLRGGQATKGGLLNAVTAFSQTVGSADRAMELDSAAMRVLDLA
jgi:hypothetical protein